MELQVSVLVTLASVLMITQSTNFLVWLFEAAGREALLPRGWVLCCQGCSLSQCHHCMAIKCKCRKTTCSHFFLLGFLPPSFVSVVCLPLPLSSWRLQHHESIRMEMAAVLLCSFPGGNAASGRSTESRTELCLSQCLYFMLLLIYQRHFVQSAQAAV